jgi:hypothetical protein
MGIFGGLHRFANSGNMPRASKLIDQRSRRMRELRRICQQVAGMTGWSFPVRDDLVEPTSDKFAGSSAVSHGGPGHGLLQSIRRPSDRRPGTMERKPLSDVRWQH